MTYKELGLKDVDYILKKHNEFFECGETKNIKFKIKQLNLLKNGIKRYENNIYKALNLDLGKNEFESYATEIGFILSSIEYSIKNLKSWSKCKKVKTPIYLLPSKSFKMYEPYGTVLIMGPYNYPFQLLFEPLIGAISAGNCAVIKPSELSPNVSKVISKIIFETFNENYIRCIEGGIETNTSLINSNFDYIFFTGSINVGKIVMRASADNLTPVTLELGGKSPVIIDESANIKVAAKRIIWGKTLNAGQTCVAPDYVLVHVSVKDRLIKEMKKAIQEFYGTDPEKSTDFGRIINEKHFKRIKNIIDNDKEFIVYGGKTNYKTNYIEPTIIDITSFECACMQEEIFGPILPVISYSELNEIIRKTKKLPKPLALYVFTNNKSIENKVLSEISSGGACVNDVITHLVNPNLPFGGVGSSGVGSYHGYNSFLTFSHEKSVLKKSDKVDITLLFPPYNKRKLNIIKKFMK
ncbi:aldehyde dehydrogenase [Clostridium botulinum]|uniref:Aldehyde dehydrogenase n=1 Tax=Clostridium botulinum TaxID=1491 RepID=A0A6B4JLX0_CLOBO|nr:aldehyde dehydrogenase [Clostridium botulinum]EES49986.1 probable aldehyde dehydrogenase AldX [Clostridium botulinum E1 str. 'BoNT E Beluga']MBY6761169.1 aldehyde dehydrogenase [Clostridium botulinum]MBY6921353.1 aldehyde dehydrogenase [Clostridium botulinum]MCR1132084.1 aldehyde dehydrogenase [Clostridium botulinum]NFH70841.1 aldehyde dehydrogenase [Clostridium botulinum]